MRIFKPLLTCIVHQQSPIPHSRISCIVGQHDVGKALTTISLAYAENMEHNVHYDASARTFIETEGLLGVIRHSATRTEVVSGRWTLEGGPPEKIIGCCIYFLRRVTRATDCRKLRLW